MSPGRSRIAVLMGGNSAEREVSLMSGAAVLDGLVRQGFEAFAVDPSIFDVNSLCEKNINVAFIMLHGRGGEDGVIQGVLTHAKIPYTGSGVLACSLTMDKWRTKLVWQALGIPTPPCFVINDKTDFNKIASELGFPLVVKPNSEGSTIGLTKVNSMPELIEGFNKAREFDDIVLAEKWIEGIELTASVLNDKALPLVQIEAPGGNYDYQAKYFSNRTKYLCPSSLKPLQEEKIKGLCLEAFQSLGCSGWGRVDLMLDRSGKPWLLEVNTVPGMTNHSLVPMSAKAMGITFDQLLLKILENTHVE